MSIGYIKGFNALRALSIILVLQAHLGTFYLLPENSFLRDRFWFLISGGTGVNIFFVISGFLITRILLKERETSGTINLRYFYARRFLRLAPALTLLLLILVSLMKLGLIKKSYLGVLMAATYTFNFAPLHDMTPELVHMWSLSVEEQYYFLWPLSLLIFKDFRKELFLIGGLLSICIIAVQHLGKIPFINTKSVNIHEYNIIIGDFFNIKRWFIPSIAPILTGSLFAFVLQYFPIKFKFFFSKKRLTLLVALIFFIAPLFISLGINAAFHIIQSFGVGLLLTWLFYNQESDICQFLERQPLKYIGTISYGLYVYHGLFIRTGPGGTLWFQQPGINVFFTLLFAVLSYELIEKKILLYKSRFRQ